MHETNKKEFGSSFCSFQYTNHLLPPSNIMDNLQNEHDGTEFAIKQAANFNLTAALEFFLIR